MAVDGSVPMEYQLDSSFQFHPFSGLVQFWKPLAPSVAKDVLQMFKSVARLVLIVTIGSVA